VQYLQDQNALESQSFLTPCASFCVMTPCYAHESKVPLFSNSVHVTRDSCGIKKWNDIVRDGMKYTSATPSESRKNDNVSTDV
jgi:hypothetical protein